MNRFVEKPPKGQEPSNLAIMGRYVLTPEIFEYLGRHETGSGGEIQLTDAIQKLNEDLRRLCVRFRRHPLRRRREARLHHDDDRIRASKQRAQVHPRQGT